MLKLLLYPFALLYGLFTEIRNRLYDVKTLKSCEFDFPVISIGNITVGGTGKTPHTEYLLRLLSGNIQIAALSRGYKRKTKDFRLVETSSTVNEVGDEPLQIKHKFPMATVAVSRNRVKGIRRLMQEKPSPDMVILDDAFQHRRVLPGLNILLVDYNKPLAEDHLLPVGRLRENVVQSKRANIIIFTKCPAELTPIQKRILAKDMYRFPYQDIFFSTMVYDEIFPAFPEALPVSELGRLRDMSALGLAGIASPQYFLDYLSGKFRKVYPLTFPDHYAYTEKTISKILHLFEEMRHSRKIIVVTEKDLVKLWEMRLPFELRSVLYYLPMKVKFLAKEGQSFDEKILEYVGEDKSYRGVHQGEYEFQN
ncbi:MAG: tetraacyldisaccharide 4'-kinase [Prolixibacteraceae bacterium]|nr:tetraacyldisaccharide 4'-kinase [Prolixibacteraceae bacterium]